MANRTLLINTADLTGFTDININESGEVLRNAVWKAQEMMLKPIIGLKLYEKIADGIVNSNLADPYLSLKDTYIVPMLIQASRVNVIDDKYLSLQRNALGQIVNSPSFQGASRVQYKELKEMALGETEFYTDRLREYLSNNVSLFPELVEEVDITADEADLDTDTNYGSPLIISQRRLNKRRNKF